MATLEEHIDEYFQKNPHADDKGCIAELKEVVDPKTKKKRWHTSTIRTGIHKYKNIKRKEIKPNHIEKQVPPETKGSPAKPEGYEIKKHPDMFPLSAKDAEEKNKSDVHLFHLENMMRKNDEFKNQMTELMGSFINGIKKELVSIKDDVSSLKNQLPMLELVEVEYDEIELEKQLIDTIDKKVEEQGFLDRNKYLHDLLKKDEKFSEVVPFLDNIEKLAKEKKVAFVKVYYADDGVLSFNEEQEMKKKSKFGLKEMLIGLAIGFGIGMIVTYFISLFVPL